MCAPLLVLAGAAAALNERGPDMRGCTVAAGRVMARGDYTVAMMELMGRESVPACRELTERQYLRALAGTYETEYGHHLAKDASRLGVPSPSYRARSARSQLGQR